MRWACAARKPVRSYSCGPKPRQLELAPVLFMKDFLSFF